jgi:two-component system sensor histidine kinase KdpD
MLTAAANGGEDVADLRAAGPDVLTTTNVANLRSVRDYAARLTGAGMVESVPDEFVRSGEVVLVDLPPEALRQRIARERSSLPAFRGLSGVSGSCAEPLNWPWRTTPTSW